MGHEEENTWGFSSLYCVLFQLLKWKSKFVVLHSDIKSLKTGLLHFTSKPYCKKVDHAIVKDGIINLILRNYLIDGYNRYFVWYTLKIQENANSVWCIFSQGSYEH